MAARAMRKSNISFGSVNTPIQVSSATQEEKYTSFNQPWENGLKIMMGGK
jgi:non-homologous end joining protein Ku